MLDRRKVRLAVLLAIFFVLGCVHNIVIPLFEAPDEVWHFSFVQVLATQHALPEQPTEGKDMWLREAGQPPLYYLVAAPVVAVLDTSDFPDFVRFNVAHPAITAHSQSTAPNVFIHTHHETFPYTGAVLALHLVRLLSLCWGMGALAGVYLMACEIIPGRQDLSLAATAVAAFNPHFIYISSVVNNDIATICMCTLTLWLSIRWIKARLTYKTTLALGLVLGLALLTKLSALALLALVSLALGVKGWKERNLKPLLLHAVMIFGVAGLIAGWWYLRNWRLYGDPLAWRVWLIDIGEHEIGGVELLRQFGHVATSFWAPYDGLFPPIVFWVLGLLVVLATAGWIKRLVRRELGQAGLAEGCLLAFAWFVALFASLVRYMTITPAAAGRLLFPALASSSLFLVSGWEAFFPPRWSKPAITGAGTALLLLSIVSPLCAIGPRYAWPLLDSADQVPDEMVLDEAVFDGMRLLGMDVEPERVQHSGTVEVTLYWQVQEPPPADLRTVLQLWTVGGRLIGQLDTTPAGEVYPPDLWRAEDIVQDRYLLPVTGAGPALGQVTVSLLAGDEEIGAVSSPAAFTLAGRTVREEEIPYPLSYTLGDSIALLGYRVDEDPSALSMVVTLYWHAQAEVTEDYVVFVHLLDSEGALMGQGDGPPLGGDYPSSSWMPGEILVDDHPILLKEPLSTGDGDTLVVGLYRLADGFRLPVYTSTGERVAQDAVRIDLGPF